MDFDLSKENIQPLRGGRNVAQLGIALQAQSSQEVQRELFLQKEYVLFWKVCDVLICFKFKEF